MIAMLMGHIFYATVNRIAKVEDDYHKMMELKKRAEAADVAKSQVFMFSVLHRSSVFRLYECVCGLTLSYALFSSLPLFPTKLELR